MASNSAPIAPLLKADTATLTFSASKDGKLRVTYAEWDDARACASARAAHCLGDCTIQTWVESVGLFKEIVPEGWRLD
jgi:hypothetical protein